MLRDELWPDAYRVVEVPGREPAVVHELLPPTEMTARLAHVSPADPAALAPKAAPRDDARIGALIGLVCAAPEDDAPRRVLADALLEAGNVAIRIAEEPRGATA